MRAALRALSKIDLPLAASLIVIAGMGAYAATRLDPYLALFMLPFFAVGCRRGKRPLALIALSLVPATLLLIASVVKFSLIGVPLVTYDHYFLRHNLLILAYNDWRVAAVLVVLVGATLWYLKTLVSGKGVFTRFEKAALPALSLFAAFNVNSLRQLDGNMLNWDMVPKPPTLENLAKSWQLPPPGLHVDPSDTAPALQGENLKPPVAGRPDIFFVLEESTFPPEALQPTAHARFLFTTSAARSGPLHVHTWAGGTWKTEFSVVAQMRPQEFGGDGEYVFHQLTGRVKRSIFTALRSQGYRTLVFYPVPGYFLNAHAFYDSIGVDEFCDPDCLGLDAGWSWKVTDADLYKAALRRIASTQQPVAAFILTINQHGPHDVANPMADYIARFRESDAAYGGFLEALAKRGRRAGVVVFGDHQPEFTARFLSDESARHITGYDIRCVNFTCADGSSAPRRPQPLDATMLVPVALQEFGFGLDDLSAYQRAVFHDCEADILRCGERAQARYNSAFAQFFE